VFDENLTAGRGLHCKVKLTFLSPPCINATLIFALEKAREISFLAFSELLFNLF